MQNDDNAPSSPAGMILGVLGLLISLMSCGGALFPICGCPMSLVGLGLSIGAVWAAQERSAGKLMGFIGLALAIIALLATLVNGVWGAYLGATGQHDLMNMMQ